MRDWSDEGVPEREASYGRMVNKIKKLVPIMDPSGPAPCVLVPGAGLGRLCVDLAKVGWLVSRLVHSAPSLASIN